MTFFDDLDLGEVELHASEHILNENRVLIDLFLKEQKKRGLTKSKIAEILDVDRSVVTRMLKANTNLTQRKVGELLYALGYRMSFRPERFICDNELPPEEVSSTRLNHYILDRHVGSPATSNTMSTKKEHYIFRDENSLETTS